MRTRKCFLPLAIVALSPLLMAPGEADCPACLGAWKGTVEEKLSNIHTVRVSRNQTYWSELVFQYGGADLEVFGRAVTNLSCKKDGAVQICTFDAKRDAEVELEVIGTLGKAEYALYFDYNDY